MRIAQWGNSVEKRGWNKDSSVRKFSGEKGWIIQPEGERKNDMGRPSFGEQGSHFIFQSSFYTLSCA